MSKERQGRAIFRTDVNLSKGAYDALKDLVAETGQNKTQVIIDSIEMRKKFTIF